MSTLNETVTIGITGDPGRTAVPRDPAGLETRAVSAWFGEHKVLERVSLGMAPGRVTALIGPSGCGKSTYLRILNRMHEMVRGASLAGEVLLGAGDIYDPGVRPADVRKRIGMVFQKPNPFPAMTVYENVASGLKLAGIKGVDKDEVVEDSLRRAGLWNEVHRRLRTPGGALSGGQQQRLCIARSLAVSPDVLLMDEPCSALDPTDPTHRGDDRRARGRGNHRHRHAQHAAGCARLPALRVLPGRRGAAGPGGRVGPDRPDLRAPGRPAHRRLRARAIRLGTVIRDP
jgi:phosphate transport system ATP-binding protein